MTGFARTAIASSKGLIAVGAVATAALLAGCALPPTHTTVGVADNGKTIPVGVGSTITVNLPAGYGTPVSSNSNVLVVRTLCAVGGGPGVIVGCFHIADADATGTATLTARSSLSCPAPPGCAGPGGPGSVCYPTPGVVGGGPGVPVVCDWRLTVVVVANPGQLAP